MGFELAILGSDRIALLCALTLRLRLPAVNLTVVRPPSASAPFFGYGEGTLASFPSVLHESLRLDVAWTHRTIGPVWMFGTRFRWGPRSFFDVTFEPQLYTIPSGLRKQAGYYLNGDDWGAVGIASALMSEGKAFVQTGPAQYSAGARFGYQLDRPRLEAALEAILRQGGTRFVDAPSAHVEQDERGIKALVLGDGTRVAADLFVDATGLHASLIGEALAEPSRPFAATLPCDRYVCGRRPRTGDETIRPCITVETTPGGWVRRTEHEHCVDFCHVYASRFMNDADADTHLRSLGVEPTERGAFTSGRRERCWVKNVVAVGESAAVAEPIHPAALTLGATQAQWIAEVLSRFDGQAPEAAKTEYNRLFARAWESAAQLPAIHYRFNTADQSDFWRFCRENVSLGAAEAFVEQYRQVGPSGIYAPTLLDRHDPFGREAYLAALLGLDVPHGHRHAPDGQERTAWGQYRESNRQRARAALGVADALRLLGLTGGNAT